MNPFVANSFISLRNISFNSISTEGIKKAEKFLRLAMQKKWVVSALVLSSIFTAFQQYMLAASLVIGTAVLLAQKKQRSKTRIEPQTVSPIKVEEKPLSLDDRVALTVPTAVRAEETPLKTFRPEFEAMLETVKKVQNWAMPDNPSFYGCSLFTRAVYKGLNEQETILYLKTPGWGRYNALQTIEAPLEELAYKIDQLFKFNVVPNTICFEKKEEIEEFSRLSRYTSSLRDQKVIVAQQAIQTPRDQPYIQTSDEQLNSLEKTHLQKAVFLNLILGREDGRKENSVCDLEGKLFEIDNERIGSRKSDSWIFSKFQQLTFDQSIIDLVKDIEEPALEAVFNEFENHHPLDIQIKKNILENFRLLKKYVTENTQIEINALCSYVFGISPVNSPT